ncbi:MAG TPA: serine hydrolase [Methylomusa anaerophila]|uniref:D-alanyl-D-alanine carboxypeptidase n=1 Tax=Methylomusa anaerophila TaxID=1930071 RepID=A0A348AHH0_9FIRM|nr:serine hydrolase [Methylomusa anaerophila]BBB90518.1 D-alanyl-D-alanine carboxypeptidase precursor [Methylomusa anaerophila]HML89842.1 serine hydrolase [Methylomusa anaerophila]
MRKLSSCYRRLAAIAAAILWSVCPVQQAWAEYYPLAPYIVPAKPSALDNKLLSIMTEHKIVGLAAAVFQGDKIVWSSGYGWADLKTPRQAGAETIFRVASISKMITATALMQLYDQGKFALDDDISRYLGYQVRNPGYPDVKITFRHLLTHTSSILDSGSYNNIIQERPELLSSIQIKDMLVPGGSYYSPATFANYPPGTSFSYSNFGAGIIGSLVEAISGMPFEKYCLKYIFGPLKMDAGFDPADIANWKNLGLLYRPDETCTSFQPVAGYYDAKPQPYIITAPLGNALGWSPAGGTRANVLDLSKFMMAHMNGGSYNKARILKAETADLMHDMQWFGYSMDGFYKQKGLNFHISDDLVPGQRLTGHSAEAYGLIGDAYFDPDSKFGMVFLMNGGNYRDAHPFYRVENDVANALYSQFAPKPSNNPRAIKARANDSLLSVNNRKIFMPVPASVAKPRQDKILFVPEMSAADALKARITQNAANNTLTFVYGANKVLLTAGQSEMDVNGNKVRLPQAPYKTGNHVMVPLRELSLALGVKTDLNF